jgi:hypothetical protein
MFLRSPDSRLLPKHPEPGPLSSRRLCSFRRSTVLRAPPSPGEARAQRPGWRERHPPPRRVSHVPQKPFPTCRGQYPGEGASRFDRPFEALTAFPRVGVGRPSHLSRVSRLARPSPRYGPQGCSLPEADSFLAALNGIGCPTRPDDSYRGGSTAPRVDLASTGLLQLPGNEQPTIMADPTPMCRSGPLPGSSRDCPSAR